MLYVVGRGAFACGVGCTRCAACKKVVSLAVALDIDLRVAYLLITLMHWPFLWGRCLTRRS